MVELKKRERDQLEGNPIRMCSKKCYFFSDGRDGCTYYQKKKVKIGDTCLQDLMHLKTYAEAFETGDTTAVKKDASEVTAMIMMQIRRMLEQVNTEGVTIKEVKTDARGMPVWIPDMEQQPDEDGKRPMIPAMETRDHPLISRVIQLARSIGINLTEFKLTPKSADEKAKVSGHLVVENAQSIQDAMKEREAIEEKFYEAIATGDQLTVEDPVYKKLKAEGDIIDDSE